MRKIRLYLTAEEKGLGIETMPMEAKFRGGRCGLCGATIPQGEQIQRFRGRGWVHVPCVTRVVGLEENLRNAERSHADPIVAAAYARHLPEILAELSCLLGSAK